MIRNHKKVLKALNAVIDDYYNHIINNRYRIASHADCDMCKLYYDCSLEDGEECTNCILTPEQPKDAYEYKALCLNSKSYPKVNSGSTTKKCNKAYRLRIKTLKTVKTMIRNNATPKQIRRFLKDN